MHYFALLTLCSLNRATSEVYHIVTTPNDDFCPRSCLTLSQFAKNPSYHLHTNITLIFLPGTHYLSVNLTLIHLYNLSMDVESQLTTVQIECTSASRIQLSSIQCVYINSLEFVGCEGNQIEKMFFFGCRLLALVNPCATRCYRSFLATSSTGKTVW